MIKGIGTDIVEIEKIKNHSQKKSFLKKVFTNKEINYAKKKKDLVSHLATTFAAKEAVFKALGTGWIDGKLVEVVREKSGKPSIILHGKVREMMKDSQLSLSLSYSNNYALAFAIIEKKK